MTSKFGDGTGVDVGLLRRLRVVIVLPALGRLHGKIRRQAEHHVILDGNIGLGRRIGRRWRRRRRLRPGARWLLRGGRRRCQRCLLLLLLLLLLLGRAAGGCWAAGGGDAAGAGAASGFEERSKVSEGFAFGSGSGSSFFGAGGASADVTISTVIGSAVTEPYGCTSVKNSTSIRTDR